MLMELDGEFGSAAAAARQRNYRQRKKACGAATSRGERGKKVYRSKWATAQFIALDGEGIGVGEPQKFAVGDDGKEYLAQEHHYNLLAASSGESLYNHGKRLETLDCINFLCDLGATYKKAIFVIFAGGYDINHILMYGFEREELKRISRGEVFEFEKEGVFYSIEYRARKSLTLKRGREFTQDKAGKINCKWKSKITIWDVLGFFQEGFVGVMGKWLGKTHPHYELIKNMKARRGDFAHVDQALINKYNEAELSSLVDLMKKVHEAVDGLELKVNRWDGAGSIAAALFRKHATREYKSDEMPDEVKEASRTAYAGGRIEICKLGHHEGSVYDYDLNSAYPSVMKNCPCLKHGVWVNGKGEPPVGFTLVKARYKFWEGQRFYPLFFRTQKMQISFPSDGCGWYWYPEYEAAQIVDGELEPLEYWHWQQSDCKCNAFGWIPDYYATRQQWVRNPSEEWQRGGEKIIKLGLNSLYGKTAQQLGGTCDRPPTYHQLEWAGYITSATRARLFRAAFSDPESVIGFATDGIFSTRPLNIGATDQKIMGDWELKQPVPVGLTIALAGVYWWHNADGGFTHFSRGFDKDFMKNPDRILKAWKAGQDTVEIPMRRLIGMGSACTSDTLWEMRGRFAEGVRSLRLDGRSHKRFACDVKKAKPHKRLVDLEPTRNVEFGYGLQECSFPYPVKWLDVADEDYEFDLEMTKEIEDSLNV